MKNSPFPPELRTMSIVPRWSIVWTTQRDNVANHSYYVAVYSHMIARMIRWQGPKSYLMFAALLHDADETVTGDIVSPIKPQIIDGARADSFIDQQMMDRMGGLMNELGELSKDVQVKYLEEADLIIKVADRLDALLFLIIEKRRGNSVIEPLILDATNRLEAAFRDLPIEDENRVNYMWNTVMLPSIQDHYVEGGRGLV